jgi:hypothetical protein
MDFQNGWFFNVGMQNLSHQWPRLSIKWFAAKLQVNKVSFLLSPPIYLQKASPASSFGCLCSQVPSRSPFTVWVLCPPLFTRSLHDLSPDAVLTLLQVSISVAGPYCEQEWLRATWEHLHCKMESDAPEETPIWGDWWMKYLNECKIKQPSIKLTHWRVQ